MSRVIVYNTDGTVQSAYDTSGTSATASAPSNGANGVIKATSITNSGTTTLQQGLTLTGGILTFADGSTQSSASSGGTGGTSSGPSNGATGTIQASSITNSGNTTLQGTLSVQGASTLAAVSAASLTLQSGGSATFADGTTQTTAYTGSVTNSNGATGAIAASSITNSGDTSLTGKLTVGGTTTLNGSVQALGLTVTGTTNLQQGVSVGQNVNVTGNVSAAKLTASSDITGSGNLNVSGASSTATLGNTTVNNMTLASSGKVTFADGTTQTTAATTTNPGSATAFTATSPGSATAPAYTATGTTNSGVFFSGSGTTSAVNLTVNGATAAKVATTGVVLPTGTSITFPDGTTQTTAAAASSSSTARTYIPMGTQWRSTSATGIYRTYDTINQMGTTTANRVETNVQMPKAGTIVGLHIYSSFAGNQATSLEVFKNAPTATTSPFIDVSALPASGQYPTTPITFTPGTYTFNAGDILGMATTTSSTNGPIYSVGLYVQFTA